MTGIPATRCASSPRWSSLRRSACCASTSAAWCSGSAASSDRYGPGLVLLIPIIDQLVRVDLRTVTLDIPPQDLITRDNAPARVNAIAYFRVVQPRDAIVQVERFLDATSQIAQTTLRSILGKAELDMLLAERERLNKNLQQIIDEQTEPGA